MLASVLVVAGALPAAAQPIIYSLAEAAASESGEDPGVDGEVDEKSSAGETAFAEGFRCPGDTICVLPPNPPDPYGAEAAATTTFGSNRARSYGASGPGTSENNVIDSARAESFWADEWIFDVAPTSVGRAVLLQFQIDGSWANNGSARFEVAVGTPTTTNPNPDDTDPFPVLLDVVTGLAFDNTAEAILTVAPFGFIPVADGGEPDGSVDQSVIISFVPEAGITYVIGARLRVESVGEESEQSARFDSTAALTRVIVPEGVSFDSAADASYDVVVPEPSTALLLALGASVIALSRRGQR